MPSDGPGYRAHVTEQTVADVAVIGGGNMGAALLGGMISSGSFEASQLAVVEVLDARRDALGLSFPGVVVTARVPRCRSAVLAVKPHDVAAAAESACEAGATRLLSIAAGVRLATIEAAAAGRAAVVRAMPNTPALVGRGAAAVAAGGSADADDVAWAESILSAVGMVERLPEALLDAFTGVAGSGPAYVFLFAEGLIDAAVEQGIGRAMAERIVRQLLVGASALLDRDGDPIGLRAQVTSPGGTTEAGIAVLEARGLRADIALAVNAATTRSRELG
jgi:pyrroline-5-carboxylate reductase